MLILYNLITFSNDCLDSVVSINWCHQNQSDKISNGHITLRFHQHLVCLSVYRSIRRIIFNSLKKPNVNEKGEKHMEIISTSQALQISGRAGR